MSRSPETNGDTVVRDPIAQYMREIGETDLLGRDAEYALAGRVKRGDTVAREQMIKANLRLVVSIAQQYQNKGFSLDDLIQEGNTGLLRATKKFNRKMGTRFNTYATWWIKQAIKSALSTKSRNVDIPAYMIDLLAKFREMEGKMVVELNRPVRPEEVIKRMHIAEDQAALLMQARQAQQSPVRDTGDGDNDEETFGIESIEDESLEVIQQSILTENREKLRQLLPLLEPRQREILEWRYGLNREYNGGQGMTLEQVAGIFRITRERVRQIEEKAVKRLIVFAENPRIVENFYSKKTGPACDPI